ncbi:MAG: hypothetical protein QG641_366 [Candidatus Poribacteria bacterium]|nr:hypothetical protein [Candidatus Poribacteria bacterium]
MIMLIENHKTLPKFLISLVLITGILVYPALSEPIINVTKIQVPKEEGKTKMGNIYYVDATNGRDSNDGLSHDLGHELFLILNELFIYRYFVTFVSLCLITEKVVLWLFLFTPFIPTMTIDAEAKTIPIHIHFDKG